MRVCVKRSVSLQPQYKDRFFELILEGVEEAGRVMGVVPKAFVDLAPKPDRIDVRVFTDFDSLAQYEETFLHGVLKNDVFLNAAASAAEMIHDNPRDELFARLDANDYFMNRLGDQGFADLAPTSAADVRKYRIERVFYPAPGRLRETLIAAFAFNPEFARKFGCIPEHHCSRFMADRIGAASQVVDFDAGIAQYLETFREFDGVIAEKHPDMLQRPTVDTLYRRIDEELIGMEGLDDAASGEARLVA